MTPSASAASCDLLLRPGRVDLATLRRVHTGAVHTGAVHTGAVHTGDLHLRLDPAARAAMQAAQATVQRIVGEDQVVYGINTGFGKLASTRIAHQHLAALQRNLVLSHSAGTGQALDDAVVRLVLVTKALGLARGHSGVDPAIAEALLELANAQVLPLIPAKGSVGASGDLAPLAHLACVLMGEGQARHQGRVLSGREALQVIGRPPFVLGPKEGLALLNGTQVSTSLALAALFGAENVFAAALVAGALSLEAIKGSVTPFDARIHCARGQPGQMAVAAALRALLSGSAIAASHPHCARVQDPYSIRCMPQVMGACLDQLRHAARVLEIEANGATDNPLVFADGDVLSGGNFHAEPVAFAADGMALAVAEIGAMSERRIALLLDTHLSGLPAFLVPDSGLNSGFMLTQVTAAALASENKSLAHPASVDSLPTSANQEDHVSMATFAAHRLAAMVDNTAVIVGIEAAAAAQGLEFDRRLRSSPLLEAQFGAVRERVAFLAQDRCMAPDIEAMRRWAHQSDWPGALLHCLPSHEAHARRTR